MSIRKAMVFLSIAALAASLQAFSQSTIPIQGATVVAVGDRGYGEATTDAEGYFRIEEGIVPGTYTIRVSARGYISKVIEGVEVSAGEEDLGDIELEPSAAVVGVVRTPEGRPAAGVPVVLLNERQQPVTLTVTEDDGSFTLDTDIRTGTYRVRAYAFSFEGFTYQTVSVGPAQVRVPVPGRGKVYLEGYASGEVGVSVKQGEVARVEVTLTRSAIISGSVTDEEGNPVEGVLVIAFSPAPGLFEGFYAVTGANGRYRIANNLASGTYNVTPLFPRGYIWSFRDAKQVEVKAGEEVTVDFKLRKSGIISGTVEYSDGTPAANATVIAVSRDGRYFGYAISGIDGSFRIDSGLDTGTYQVMAFAGKAVFSVPVEVDVTAGKETSGVRLVLRGKGKALALLEGKVTDEDGNPIEGAEVSSEYGHAQTDEEGGYRLYVWLPQGTEKATITVTAWARGYEELEKQVEVEAGRSKALDFQLKKIREAVIRGRVVGTAAPPTPGRVEVTISITASRTEITVGESVTISGTTDPPVTGRVDVLVAVGGKWVKIDSVDVSEGKFTYEFVPRRPGPHRVKVAWPGDEEHRPAESAPVLIVVSKVVPSIEVTVSPTSAKVGEAITISGEITPFRGETDVEIVVQSPSETRSFTVRSSDGTFTYSLEVDATGTWRIRARVPESAIYEAAESDEVTVAVEEERKCIIATVTFGSEIAPEVDFLRDFRDNFIRRTYLGERFYAAFDAFYYSWSTPVARCIASHPILKAPVKALIYPLIGVLKVASVVSMPLFQWSPELASLLAGLAASSLLGATYLAPLITLAAYAGYRRGRRPELLHRIPRVLWTSAGAAAALAVISQAAVLDYVATASTSAYVLLTMAAAATTLSKILVGKLSRRD